MKIVDNPSEMRSWSMEQKCAGHTIGFVPTMGALHEGHAALMREAVAKNNSSVISIFVNPTQFAPHEDFDRYPRKFDDDVQLAEKIGIEAIYAPKASVMYPEGYETYVTVDKLSERLCGRTRPTFFRGVATVVTKLFNVVLPDRAYFGQKDAQQCAVIRRMARDLDFGIEIVELPIVREPDGLARSSRNEYLSEAERERACCLYEGLMKAQEVLEAGERDPSRVIGAIRRKTHDVSIDYAEVVDAEEIQPIEKITGPVLVAVAAFVGDTRLIDNIKFTPPEAVGDGSG